MVSGICIELKYGRLFFIFGLIGYFVVRRNSMGVSWCYLWMLICKKFWFGYGWGRVLVIGLGRRGGGLIFIFEI